VPETMTFPLTHQGVRNLDVAGRDVIPFSGGPGSRLRGVNVGLTERYLSAAGGGLLALFGLARGGLAGLGLALAGGALLYRGFSGHCPLYGALGRNTAGRGQADSREEVVYRAR